MVDREWGGDWLCWDDVHEVFVRLGFGSSVSALPLLFFFLSFLLDSLIA